MLFCSQVKCILHLTAEDDVDEIGCVISVKCILHWTAGGDVENLGLKITSLVIFPNGIDGGDLDEMIDFQIT